MMHGTNASREEWEPSWEGTTRNIGANGSAKPTRFHNVYVGCLGMHRSPLTLELYRVDVTAQLCRQKV